MNTIAVIQARMGSTRLPGKVMRPLCGHPVLEWVVRAVQAAPFDHTTWVATSVLEADDVIANWCDRNFVPCWRGSETDVLDRFMGVAKMARADVILRITADEPFIDPQVIAQVAELQRRTGASYVSNVHPRTYPDGLDVECFTREALEAAHKEATRTIDRDTVTYWITRNRSRFPAEALINPLPNMAKERWVLDTEEDFALCEAIVHRWPWSKGPPSMLDILCILDRDPITLRHMNGHLVANERFHAEVAKEEITPRTYTRSQAQFERAQKVIPLAAQTFSKSHLQYPQPSPLFLSHGQGAVVWDIDGNEYVDLVSALLPNVLGYRDPDVDAAIRRQLAAGISFSLATELEAKLAETLKRLIPCAESTRFGKTGTDVTTAAVRLARAYTKRDQVLICGGYHGWADWCCERNAGIPQPMQWRTTRVNFGATPPIYHGGYAAVIVEPHSNPEYLRFLREACDGHKTLLIFDEVITGFRYSLGGAQEYFGVTPDLACFGKAMANGMPLSALVGKREYMRKLEPPDNVFFSGTFFGETLSLAAAIATIDKLEREGGISELWYNGFQVRDVARRAIEHYGLTDIIALLGEDPFVRLQFNDDDVAALFRKEMAASCTLIIASHNVSTSLTAGDIARVKRSYDHTCLMIADAIKAKDIKARLAGAAIAKGVR